MATANSLAVLRDNAPEPADKAARWSRLRITGTAVELLSTSGAVRKWRVRGQALAELYVPAKQGASVLRTLCDAITTTFRGITLASPDIRFAPPTFGQVQDSAGWARRDATIAFMFDEEG